MTQWDNGGYRDLDQVKHTRKIRQGGLGADKASAESSGGGRGPGLARSAESGRAEERSHCVLVVVVLVGGE